MNKFVFRPVGQGLFYTGSLLNGRYAFDNPYPVLHMKMEL